MMCSSPLKFISSSSSGTRMHTLMPSCLRIHVPENAKNKLLDTCDSEQPSATSTISTSERDSFPRHLRTCLYSGTLLKTVSSGTENQKLYNVAIQKPFRHWYSHRHGKRSSGGAKSYKPHDAVDVFANKVVRTIILTRYTNTLTCLTASTTTQSTMHGLGEFLLATRN